MHEVTFPLSMGTGLFWEVKRELPNKPNPRQVHVFGRLQFFFLYYTSTRKNYGDVCATACSKTSSVRLARFLPDQANKKEKEEEKRRRRKKKKKEKRSKKKGKEEE